MHNDVKVRRLTNTALRATSETDLGTGLKERTGLYLTVSAAVVQPLQHDPGFPSLPWLRMACSFVATRASASLSTALYWIHTTTMAISCGLIG